MKSYCVKQRKITDCIPGSEQYVKTKNGRDALKGKCSECGIIKFRFVSKAEIQGSGFDELIVKGLASGAKGLFNLGRRGASQAIKSDAAKKKFKEIGQKYLDEVIGSVTDDVSKRIAGKGLRKKVSNYLISENTRNKIKQFGHKNLDRAVDSVTYGLANKISGEGVAQSARQTYGKGVDIHKAIGKLPKPKRGWTLPGHKYTGPYNPLHKQVLHDDTGKILEIYDMPTGATDAVAMQHDVDYTICKDDKKCKHRADKKMVSVLDAVPWEERQWGHWLARNTINTKRKLGLGTVKKKRPKFTMARKISR